MISQELYKFQEKVNILHNLLQNKAGTLRYFDEGAHVIDMAEHLVFVWGIGDNFQITRVIGICSMHCHPTGE